MQDFLRRLERLEHRRPIHRVLVIKPSALGDVVQCLPLLGPLQARFPDAEIGWTIGRESAGLLEGHERISRLHLFDRRGPVRRQLALAAELRAARYDLVFDLQGLLRTGLMTWMTGAPLRVGLETTREGSRYACHTLLPGTGRDVAAHERYWQVAEALGMGSGPRTAELAIPEETRRTVSTWLAHLPRPLLAIHSGAKWETKRWPPERFADVACRFVAETGGGCVLVGGPTEVDLARAVLDRMPHGSPVVNLAGRSSLKELAVVLETAGLVLSNDSGPMHLGAAMGTPVVGVFTCTDPILSGPAGEGHERIATGVTCAAGYHKTCPHSGTGRHACFTELDPLRVWQGVRRVVDRIDSRRRAG
jgi:heptosyltransferase I